MLVAGAWVPYESSILKKVRCYYLLYVYSLLLKSTYPIKLKKKPQTTQMLVRAGMGSGGGCVTK